MSEWLKVFAPATVANVGPGYDVFGFALHEPGDVVEVRKIEEPGVRMAEVTGDGGKLPRDSSENTAGVAATEVRELLGAEAGVEIKLHKGMPLGSGLGSSAASAAAAAWAVNVLFGKSLEKEALLPACMAGEKAASGAAHADNAAPSLLGGFVLIRSYDPLDVVPLPAPEALVAVVAVPACELKTAEARAAVPKKIPLQDAVRNWGNVSAVTAALYTNDIRLLGRAMDDRVVEPARAPLVPGFHDVKRAALEHGAYGCSMSGAGPSVFAVTDDREAAKRIAAAMRAAFAGHGLESRTFVSNINEEGAKAI
jgi:homoserine kinase